ncbi:MAG: DUF721 domain-containing protein [Synechococcus sp. ELA057]
MQSRRLQRPSLLVPATPPPALPLARCLETLQKQWRQEGNRAALWQAWPAIAGPQLAPHCRPLQWQGDVLTVGAAPGPWLQALPYNRLQLLGALRAAGFPLRDLRFRQVHAITPPPAGSAVEDEVWALHPSRMDVHGQADCPSCNRPAPAGEMARWGHCSFCQRQAIAERSPGAALGNAAAGAG